MKPRFETYLFSVIFLFCAVLPCSLLKASLPSSVEEEFDPIKQPMLAVGASPWIVNLRVNEASPPNTTWGANLRVEIPMTELIKIGFQWNTALFAIAELPKPLMSFDALFRLHHSIKLVKHGYIAPYIAVPFGLAVALADFWEPNRAAGDPTHVNEYGFGPHMGASAGLEFFPIPEFGFYVEGGYQAAFLAHRTKKDEDAQNYDWLFHTYWLQGPVIHFGLKLNI
jgi:hypothetical protein